MASTKRGGLFAAILQVVFALPFVAAGLLVLWLGVSGQAKGAGAPAAIIFGVVFAGVPAFIAIRALRGQRSSESQATLQRPGVILPAPALVVDYRSPGRTSMPAGALYAGVLQSAPLPKMTTHPGRTLPVALDLGKSSDNPTAGLILSIVWLLCTTPFFVGALLAKSWLVTAFLGLFVLVGLVILFFTIRKLVSRTKLPRVEVAEEPLYLGDTLRVHLAQPGPANISRLQVDLICRERVTYTVGTTTRTEQKDVLVFPLLDDPGGLIPRGGSKTHDLEWSIPKTSPATFFAKNNNVAWLIRIRADIINFPDYDEIYEVRVLPEPPVA